MCHPCQPYVWLTTVGDKCVIPSERENNELEWNK